METNPGLIKLREQASRGLLVLLWLHVPFNFIVALWLNNSWQGPGLLAVAITAIATGSWWLSGSGLSTRLTIGIAVIGMVSLIVDQLSGHSWQLDAHMYFFASLAVLSVYCDWRVLLLSAGAIAAHHLLLNFLLPAAIYPGGPSLERVVLHAIIVVLETCVLVWLTHTLTTLFAVSQAAIEAAQNAQAGEAEAHARQTEVAIQAAGEKRKTAQTLSLRFEETVGNLVRQATDAANGVRDSSAGLSATVTYASAKTALIVSASEQTSASVQRVAAATEQLSICVGEIDRQMTLAETVASRASAEADRARTTMMRLSETSARIDDVVQLINAVATQTNLLALNATIEAARAGDMGKGFSVVAGEVKGLAKRTADATTEINGQIMAIQKESRDAVAAITGIARIISDLGQVTTAVAAAVREQDAATREIAHAAVAAAVSTETISTNLESLANMANETGKAASSGFEASTMLTINCHRMEEAIRDFVVTLGTA
ncbi:MAG: methyl-accepting chemotaxis protein [Janthinobacterium lividum]